MESFMNRKMGGGRNMVHLSVIEHLSDSDFLMIENSREKEIQIDLSKVIFLSSKEISRLLILSKHNQKNITLLRANEHIRETVNVLKIGDILIIKD